LEGEGSGKRNQKNFEKVGKKKKMENWGGQRMENTLLKKMKSEMSERGRRDREGKVSNL